MVRRAVLVVAGVLAAAGAARAEPAPHELRWRRGAGAESCIAGPELAVAVEQRIGHALRPGGAAAVRVVDGEVAAAAGGFRARIIVTDERGTPLGERELVEPGADCRALDAKLGLVIALIVDPDAVGRPAPDVAPAPPPPPGPAAPPRAPWRYAVDASGVVAAGVLPGVGLGARLALVVDAPALPPVAIALHGWVPDSESVMAGGSDFTLWSGGAAMCPRLVRRARGELGVCAGAALARMAASGFDFDENRRAVDWTAHGTAELAAAIRITGRVTLRAGLGLWVPFVRPRFVYTDGAGMTRSIYQGPPAAGLVRLGVGIDL